MRSHDCSINCTALRHHLSFFGGKNPFGRLITSLQLLLVMSLTAILHLNALGKAVKDNTSLRVGTRDYDTLFESLILEPLKDLHIVGPILIVIDALDKSGDTTSRIGLHAFLAKNLKRLPSNFRVVISRPEHAIVSALAGAPSVKIKYMNDTELVAETHKDILTFLREKLPSDKIGGQRDYFSGQLSPVNSS
jgi:hypothetical protein